MAPHTGTEEEPALLPSADLPVLVQDVAEQPVGVREALGAGALPHAHDAVLLRVENAALEGRGAVGRGTGLGPPAIRGGRRETEPWRRTAASGLNGRAVSIGRGWGVGGGGEGVGEECRLPRGRPHREPLPLSPPWHHRGPQTHLLAHGLGVGDGRAEEAIPLEPSVEAGPVVVPVPGVGQAPGDEGVELSSRGVTGFARWKRGLP